MKKLTIILLLTVGSMAGCAKKPVSAPIPGQLNSFDGQEYRFLFDAEAALNSVKADVAAGKITLSQGDKTALNSAINSYNLAEAQWHAYHSGASNDQAGLAAAINSLVQQVNALVSSLGGK